MRDAPVQRDYVQLRGREKFCDPTKSGTGLSQARNGSEHRVPSTYWHVRVEYETRSILIPESLQPVPCFDGLDQ